MKLPIFITFSILCFIDCFSQVTFIINKLPENTPKDAKIYISGNFDSWSGGNEAFVLTKNELNFYTITINKNINPLEFKFTCGNWNKVEKGISGEEIKNRVYFFDKNFDTVYVPILNWNFTKKTSTKLENVKVLSDSFFIPQLKRYRRILIYLPDNYNTSKINYPVIYMHDGQNLFDDSTSFSGEWEVDETMNKLEKEYNFNAIVVAIENGNEFRVSEYTPWENSKYGGGDGAKYIEFIAKTLKPYIDKHFRTLNDSKNTAIIGSSLGGLISFYAILKYPEIFGKAGIFSPSFWYSEKCFEFAEKSKKIKSNKIYLLAGTEEDETMVLNLNKMYDLLKPKFSDTTFLNKKIIEGGKHNENLWKNEFESCVKWLFSDDFENY